MILWPYHFYPSCLPDIGQESYLINSSVHGEHNRTISPDSIHCYTTEM